VGKKPIKIDVRIIATTNLDLLQVVEEGKFRNDLYHRLNQFKIILPSLRERKEDIPLLAEEFLREANLELKKKVKDFSPKSMKLFLDYQWPGNVRELKNVVKKAVLLTEDYHVITPENIFLDRRKSQEEPANNVSYKEGETLQEIVAKITENAERHIILEVLQKEKYNKTKVAKKLGIDRKTLYSKLKKLGLE
jgi:transcriptional regulator with PAS, ATPase and Fis domain